MDALALDVAGGALPIAAVCNPSPDGAYYKLAKMNQARPAKVSFRYIELPIDAWAPSLDGSQ